MKELKKYFCAAAAMLLAGCAQDNTFFEQDPTESAIGFETVADRMTRAENSPETETWMFSNHHSDMKVWGYKASGSALYLVFNAQLVAVSADDVCSYEPRAYWDKTAKSYFFYAAAPAEGDWAFNAGNVKNNDVNTINKGYFTTSSTLADHTLTSTTYGESFKGVVTDKMIASPCNVDQESFVISNPLPVALQFNHILSRLNILVKKDPVIDEAYTVSLTKLEVVNLKGSGSFDESTASGNTLQNGTTARWTSLSDPITYTANTLSTVTTSPQYVLQSLVIPQQAVYDSSLDGGAKTPAADYTNAYLHIIYKLTTSTTPAYEEEFERYYNLAEVFTNPNSIYVENNRAAYKTATTGEYVYQSLQDGKLYADATTTTVLTNVVYKCSDKYYIVEGVVENEVFLNDGKYYKNKQTVDDETTYTDPLDDTPTVILWDAAHKMVPCTKKDKNSSSTFGNIDFCEGWQNNLYMTIGPLAIKFDATVESWAEGLNKEFVVQ